MELLSSLSRDKTQQKTKQRIYRSPKPDRTYNGITFASLAEMQRYKELLDLRESNQIEWFIRQPIFDLADVHYTADFLICVRPRLIHFRWSPANCVYAEEIKSRYKGKSLELFARNAKQVEQLYGLKVHLVKR